MQQGDQEVASMEAVIAGMPPKDQADVRRFERMLNQILADGGDSAFVAMVLVGAQILQRTPEGGQWAAADPAAAMLPTPGEGQD